jgi:PAS domain S-box-containing protein
MTAGRAIMGRFIQSRSERQHVGNQGLTPKSLVPTDMHEPSLNRDVLLGVLDHMFNGIAYCRLEYEDEDPSDWVYLYTNPSFHALTGLGPIIGKRASIAIPGIHQTDPILLAIYGRVARTGMPERFEQFVESLQHWFSVEVYCPRPGYFVSVFEVVTVRKQQEAALRESEERLSRAQAASRSGVWDWDVASGRLHWSDQLVRLFGLDPATAERSFDVWRSVLHPDDLLGAEEKIWEAIRTKQRLVNEYRIRLPSGEVRWIRADGDTIFDVQGQPSRMSGLCIDITEEKTLSDVARSASDANRQKSTFLATMSHELRTPLNSIIGFSSLILEGMSGKISDEQRQQIGLIKQSGEQLLELVSEILDIAKIEAGTLSITIEPVDLKALIEQQCALMQPAADSRKLLLETSIGLDLPLVSGDRKRSRQVVRNLLSNAIKFTDEGGVHISAVLEQDHVRVVVEDTGIGVPTAEQPQLFTPFKRADCPNVSSRSGAGLGLAISRRLIEAMGGTIGLTSELGRGSRAWFTLPLATKDGAGHCE